MGAPAPARLPREALGRRRPRRPLGTRLCAGPRAAVSRLHPRPGRQAPGAGRGGEGPEAGRWARASLGRRSSPGSPAPEEEPAPPPPPAPPRSRNRSRARRRRRRRSSRRRFSATHRRDTRAGQPCRPPARPPGDGSEPKAVPPAAHLRDPTAPLVRRCGPQGFPSHHHRHLARRSGFAGVRLGISSARHTQDRSPGLPLRWRGAHDAHDAPEGAGPLEVAAGAA